jgi:hypothetical protein
MIPPDRENLPASDRTAGWTDPAALCHAWRRRSLANGWLASDDWDSEAASAVGAAACGDGGALTRACVRLGRSRAKAGIGIAETIGDLGALFEVLDGPGQPNSGPPLTLVCSVAEGWAEEGMAQLSRGGCEDPLSGLTTVPYLRTRLAEVYREADQHGSSPADTHRLLVVSLPRRPDPWDRMALAILVGHELRTVFPGGETLCLARRNGITGSGPAIALVRERADLPMRYAKLRRRIQETFGAQIRMTRLPGGLAEALRLVDELSP